ARLPVPVIGAINGSAFGGGLELAALCDVRIASKGALFALPEASIGVTPGWSGAQRLGRLLPQALLREMALTGGQLTAERLWSVGFLNEISDAPVVRALEIAARVARLAQVANRRSTDSRAVLSRRLPTNRRGWRASGRSAARPLQASSAALVSAHRLQPLCANRKRFFGRTRPPVAV